MNIPIDYLEIIPIDNLFECYLTGKTQCVSVEGVYSELNEHVYEVPQDSVLGPIKFRIYTIRLGAILRHDNIMHNIYADDTQLYCSFDIKSFKGVLGLISDCILDIRSWMIKNKLKINDDKTEFLLITSPLSKLSTDNQISIRQAEITNSSSCKRLGVMF